MSLLEIKYCPSTLQSGFATYSPAAQQALFGSRSKKVNHMLPFGSPGQSSELTKEYNEKRKRLRISGVQEKYSLQLQKNTLFLTDTEGTHIFVLLEFFRLLVFNYLIANGDAHLKNFSLMETAQGDYLLSPAYDLLCTPLHVDDSRLALKGGLYEGDHNEKSYVNFGTYTRASFVAFAELAGINPSLATAVVDDLLRGTEKAIALVERSFLSDEAKKKYINTVRDRHKSLELS